MLTTLTHWLYVLINQLIGPGSSLHMVCMVVQRVDASATKSEAVAPLIKAEHGSRRVTGDTK